MYLWKLPEMAFSKNIRDAAWSSDLLSDNDHLNVP